jgi:glycosyltransferase involved in cell wall biosynthesis
VNTILLVCPEPLGHRHPAGVGIRFIEFARALRAAGHKVLLLSADGGSVEGCESAAISPETLRDGSARAAAAVVQGHVANDYFAHARPIPTVIDLYDPFIVENLHYSTTTGSEVFLHDYGTLMNSLQRGDLFLCASRAQRLFYLGALLAARRLNPSLFHADPTVRSLIEVVPFGVAEAPLIPRPETSENILFGGIYDWYDAKLAVQAVERLRSVVPGATLTFNRHPNADITPQGVAAETEAWVREHKLDFVRFDPWIAYEQRAAYYAGFSAALLTFPQSLETDLSMRTRVYDYLWAGLPIVTSSARGTDEIIERYDVGRVVKGSDPGAYAAALIALFSSPVVMARMSAQTRRFVTEHQWKDVLKPLVDFCSSPRFDATKPTPSASHVPPVKSIRQRLVRLLRGQK